MLESNHTETFEVVFGIVSLLLCGNVFFIKRLIHKIEQIDTLSASVIRLAAKVDDLIKNNDHLIELRIEIATLREKLVKVETSNGEYHNDDYNF